MGYIYKITNPNGKIYVGKTYDTRKRINSHKHTAKKGRGLMLSNSINKYGWEAHIFEIIEEIEDILMDEREIFWIKELNTYYQNNPNGLNMTLGGDGQRSSWMHDIERRKNQSERFSGAGNTFYGKKHTQETKKIIAEKAKERCLKTGQKVPKWGSEKGRLAVMKPTIVYDKNGDLVGEFESISIVSKKLDLALSSVKDSVIYGSWINGEYLVKYKTDNYPTKIEVGVINYRTCKRPVIWFNGDKMIEFPSAEEAAKETGVPMSSIWRAARNKKTLKTGHKFVYKDLIENPTAVGVI